MALVGFSGNTQQAGATGGRPVENRFRQTQQALELQKQIRKQLGISTNPLEAAPPNSVSVLTDKQREFLDNLDNPALRQRWETQLIDQAQQQRIMTSIGADQRKAQMARQTGLHPSQVVANAPFGLKEPPRTQSPRGMGMNFMQLSFLLNSLTQMMMGMAALGNGFSTFLGGGPVYTQTQQYGPGI